MIIAGGVKSNVVECALTKPKHAEGCVKWRIGSGVNRIVLTGGCLAKFPFSSGVIFSVVFLPYAFPRVCRLSG